MLRVIIAAIAVFVLWEATDILVHGYFLAGEYAKIPEVVLPKEEMRVPLLLLVVLAHAVIFTKIYSWLVSPTSVLAGIIFGLLWGVAHGVGMGYGMYATMRVPLIIASTWFSLTVVQGVLAGAIVGAIVRKRDEPAPGVPVGRGA